MRSVFNSSTLHDSVKRAFDIENAAVGNMGIAFGCFKAGMSQKALNITDIGAIFKKVGGKGLTKAVNGNFFTNCCMADGFIEYFLGRSYR